MRRTDAEWDALYIAWRLMVEGRKFSWRDGDHTIEYYGSIIARHLLDSIRCNRNSPMDVSFRLVGITYRDLKKFQAAARRVTGSSSDAED